MGNKHVKPLTLSLQSSGCNTRSDHTITVLDIPQKLNAWIGVIFWICFSVQESCSYPLRAFTCRWSKYQRWLMCTRDFRCAIKSLVARLFSFISATVRPKNLRTTTSIVKCCLSSLGWRDTVRFRSWQIFVLVHRGRNTWNGRLYTLVDKDPSGTHTWKCMRK